MTRADLYRKIDSLETEQTYTLAGMLYRRPHDGPLPANDKALRAAIRQELRTRIREAEAALAGRVFV